ncbi:hypothetical protein [Limnohabitans sp. Rim8]|jgi:hypothetical protein|uniref:hypothetical protein n=1 Tax=Limnohabitans sp. Rim8 TaxID=1100718 RepID=UPI0026293A40|nr:hypothetical protein [Limnohabitans sp. Rim8]
MTFFKNLWSRALEKRQRLTEAMYVPTQTGSHDLGDKYLGDMASAYIEIRDFPDAGRNPFQRIEIHVVNKKP